MESESEAGVRCESKQGIHPATTKGKGGSGVVTGLAYIAALVGVRLANLPDHARGNHDTLELAAAGDADRRPAKNADATINQSRDAHLTA